MARSNLYGWNKKQDEMPAACGAADKPAETPAACGAGDKPVETPAACGAADKPAEKPAACGSACGAGDKQTVPFPRIPVPAGALLPGTLKCYSANPILYKSEA